MTASEVIAYFDLLIDKQGSPYFTTSEKESFLTNAQLKYIKSMLPSNEGGNVNVEDTQIVYENIYTLIESVDLTPSSVNGLGVINITLNLPSLMHVMNIGVGADKLTQLPVKYTRLNEIYQFLQNVFKKPSASAPRYTVDKTEVKVYPYINATHSINYVKQPVNFSLAGGITLSTPDHTHERIVQIAVDLASLAIRDEIAKQLNE